MIFYFAVISMITPPVALAAYAAAGIGGAGLWPTGGVAFRPSLAAFLPPYAFVQNRALLFDGPWHGIAWVSATAALGAVALAAGVMAYLRRDGGRRVPAAGDTTPGGYPC